ncbi:unnamed protein product [Closterium sp. NIES-53]
MCYMLYPLRHVLLAMWHLPCAIFSTPISQSAAPPPSSFHVPHTPLPLHAHQTTLHSIPPSTATTDLPSDAAAQVTSYIDIFNIVLAAGGVFAVPLAGWSMERPGLPFSFTLTTLLCALCSAVQMMAAWVPLPMQLVAFLAFTIARAFIYSTMAAYVGTLFGFRNFGRLYGINRLGGAFLTLLQYPLMRAAPSPQEPREARRHVEFAATSGEYAATAPMPLKPQRPPCFDPSQRGGPMVQSWVFMMNVFFDANCVESDAAKIRYAVSLLRGPAMDWW